MTPEAFFSSVDLAFRPSLITFFALFSPSLAARKTNQHSVSHTRAQIAHSVLLLIAERETE